MFIFTETGQAPSSGTGLDVEVLKALLDILEGTVGTLLKRHGGLLLITVDVLSVFSLQLFDGQEQQTTYDAS
jgi:hypothetical protein